MEAKRCAVDRFLVPVAWESLNRGTTRIRDSRAKNRSIPIRRRQGGGRGWTGRERSIAYREIATKRTKREASKRERECYLIIGQARTLTNFRERVVKDAEKPERQQRGGRRKGT